MDTRFSVAIHLLILISESDSPLSSAQMAASVGTNPSFVRKVLGSLKKAGLIESRQGRTGYTLAKPSNDITLLQISRALHKGDDASLLKVHKNPSDQCVVGRHIHSTLGLVFGSAQQEAERALESTTLTDCIDDIREREARDDALSD